MATSIDHLSGLGLRIGPVRGFPAEQKKQLPASSSPHAIDDGGLFHESLIVSGGEVRPRNLWAAAGSLTFQLLLLLALIVIPLFHTDILPKRETLTTLYLQPPAAAPMGTSASNAHSHVNIYPYKYRHIRASKQDAGSATNSGRHRWRSGRGSPWRSNRRSSRWNA